MTPATLRRITTLALARTSGYELRTIAAPGLVADAPAACVDHRPGIVRVKVYVTGATGFVGGHVARELRERGAEVRDERIDLLDRAGLERAMAGCDAVVHVAALVQLRRGTGGLRARQRRGNAHRARGRGAGGRAAIRALLDGGHLRARSWASCHRGRRAAGLGSRGPLQTDEARRRAARARCRRGRRQPDDARRGGRQEADADGAHDRERRAGPDARVTSRPPGLNVVDVRDVARGHALALEHGEPGQRYLLGGRRPQPGRPLRRSRAAGGTSTAPRPGSVCCRRDGRRRRNRQPERGAAGQAADVLLIGQGPQYTRLRAGPVEPALARAVNEALTKGGA